MRVVEHNIAFLGPAMRTERQRCYAENDLAMIARCREATCEGDLSVVRTFGTTRGVGLRSAGLVLV